MLPDMEQNSFNYHTEKTNIYIWKGLFYLWDIVQAERIWLHSDTYKDEGMVFVRNKEKIL